jgi:hypothetical protein
MGIENIYVGSTLLGLAAILLVLAFVVGERTDQAKPPPFLMLELRFPGRQSSLDEPAVYDEPDPIWKPIVMLILFLSITVMTLLGVFISPWFGRISFSLVLIVVGFLIYSAIRWILSQIRCGLLHQK